MRHGSLFSGIGGFDLAAEWMGWENVFHCEWIEFPRKVLEYYWPDADSHIDICKTDFKKYANRIDILTGGFPCQPFSLAGKRKGTDDERYLWGEMLRAIQEIKPKWVIAENVFGIVNIDGGLVFEQVCLDLETEGYEVQPFIIPAAAKNAPHRRDRVWFIAYSKSARTWTDIGGLRSEFDGCSERIQKSGDATNTLPVRLQQCKDGAEMGRGQKEICGKGSQFTNGFKTNGKISNATDPNLSGCKDKRKQPKPTAQNTRIEHSRGGWDQFPTESPLCSRNDGLSTKLDGITFSKWRNESIKGYGNAIVPQIAYELFKIIEHENKNQSTTAQQQDNI
jgi:DNA (cytosine-5)-methyltransferase 1